MYIDDVARIDAALGKKMKEALSVNYESRFSSLKDEGGAKLVK